MSQTRPYARVVHAIPGRLRLRLEIDADLFATDALAAARVAPGILAVELKAAASSIVVQYDPAETDQIAVLAALKRAGIDVGPLADEASPVNAASGQSTVAIGAGAGSRRDAKGRYRRQDTEPPPNATAGPPPGASAEPGKSAGRSELWEMLIGPPPKLDRRLAESLALSAVSLLAARRVGLALGGGSTLPAYFAIWFALRRLTGAGRRR
jgi:hypothetical protein